MKASKLSLPRRPRILVTVLRRLGDVLLATPLIHSIKAAWPEARIDALVFSDTAGMLDGNPDIERVIRMPTAPTALQSIAVASGIARRYDLAVSTQVGDRPTWFSILAGRLRVAPVEDRLSGRLKGTALTRSLPNEAGLHRVEAMQRIADVLGIPRAADVVPPAPLPPPDVPDGDYAVVHAVPSFTYKRWTERGWRQVAGMLSARGLTVIATGGPGASERGYLDQVWRGTTVVRRDGELSWRELTGLLGAARVFVGPDTSVTHLAAAAGCPTVALYGPTDPRLWGPWPKGGLNAPWADAAPVQNRGNVWLLQHAFPCTPCQLEGCERHLRSDSECLKQLAPEAVCAVIEQILAGAMIA